MGYPIQRNLDGVYFRVERDGRWCNVCFSDMTEEERNKTMEDKDIEWLKRMCHLMTGYLRAIGDELGIVYE